MTFNKKAGLFIVAFTISFTGALPVGTLNATVANYALHGRMADAFEFGLGAILVEMTLVRLAVATMDKFARLKRLFLLCSLLLCVGIFYLAFKTLASAYRMVDLEETLPIVGRHAFYSGLLLSLINPLHLPFWLSWSAVLKTKGILTSSKRSYTIYILAIGAGTALSFLIYALAGRFLTDKFKEEHLLINWILGGTFLLTGTLLTIKLVRRNLIASYDSPGVNRR